MNRIEKFCNDKAIKLTLGKYVLLFSYNTMIAWSDGSFVYRAIKDADIDSVISNTTARHIKELFKQLGYTGINKKSFSKRQFKEFVY